jgi:hypothetical protein
MSISGEDSESSPLRSPCRSPFVKYC